ncbi:MAG TPA: DUF5655 domain-containing protein [Pyrinomonadaceae bacterium]|jgi:hypothetical protein
MAAVVNRHSVNDHFINKEPLVKAIYDAIVKAAEQFGPVKQEAKKTSIHLVRKTAFAGVATRQSALILTVKSKSDSSSARVIRREQVSANRWHLEVRIDAPQQVDADLKQWLKAAYELAG